MSVRLKTIAAAIQQIAVEQKVILPPLHDELSLHEAGFDSLAFAILVARRRARHTISADASFPLTPRFQLKMPRVKFFADVGFGVPLAEGQERACGNPECAGCGRRSDLPDDVLSVRGAHAASRARFVADAQAGHIVQRY